MSTKASKQFDAKLDHILELARKSAPAAIASRGSLELWEANRQFVIAGIEFVKVCAKQASLTAVHYKDLHDIALDVYHELVDSEECLVTNLLDRESNWIEHTSMGLHVIGAIGQGIEALEHFHNLDEQRREQNRD